MTVTPPPVILELQQGLELPATVAGPTTQPPANGARTAPLGPGARGGSAPEQTPHGAGLRGPVARGQRGFAKSGPSIAAGRSPTAARSPDGRFAEVHAKRPPEPGATDPAHTSWRFPGGSDGRPTTAWDEEVDRSRPKRCKAPHAQARATPRTHPGYDPTHLPRPECEPAGDDSTANNPLARRARSNRPVVTSRFGRTDTY